MFNINLFNVSLDKHINLHPEASQVIDLLKEVICKNQGAYSEYRYLAGIKHRGLRQALESQSKDTHVRVKQELLKFLSSGFNKSFISNLEYMEKYFKFRSKISPRICIKVNKNSPENQNTIDIYRSNEDVDYDKEVPIEDNSGFVHVRDKGLPFLCNDIPKAAKDSHNRYKNPRLSKEAASVYQSSKFEKYKYSKVEAYDDDKWKSCWVSGNSNIRNCYKSTLIIPITLLGHAGILSEEFKEMIEFDDKDRMIFGYLCFDHPHRDFFHNLDINIGYIFADVLSLYQLTILSLTDWSETFKAADAS